MADIKPTARDEVKAYLDTRSHRFWKCREEQHDFRTTSVETVGNVKTRVRVCSRKCGTIRHDKINAFTGRRISRRYEYTDPDYRLPEGTGRLDADDLGQLRLANIIREEQALNKPVFKAVS